MTKLTLTVENDGAQLASIVAEIDDLGKLEQIKQELKKFFSDEQPQPACGMCNGNCNGMCKPQPPMMNS